MTRFGAAAVRAVESLIDHAEGDLVRARQVASHESVEQARAVWEALPEHVRRVLAGEMSVKTARALLEVVRRSDDDERTDPRVTLCAKCGGPV